MSQPPAPAASVAAQWELCPGTPALVSVVIPTHNRADLIGETLDSVAAQSYPHVETIVVDDGSDDGTEAVVAQYPEVRYLAHERQGAPVARNVGVQASSGEFIQFLDSDDLLSPSKLKAQVDYFRRHPTTQVVYGDGYRFRHPNANDIMSTVSGAPTGKIRWHIACLQALCHLSQCLWRRAEVERIGPWDPRLIRGQDWDYQLRSLVAGEGQERFAYSAGAPTLFRHGVYGSITSPRDPDHEAIAANSLYLLAKASDVLRLSGQATRGNVSALCMRCLDLAQGSATRGFPEHAQAHVALAHEIGRAQPVSAWARLLTRAGSGTESRVRWRIVSLATTARTAAQRVLMALGMA